MSANRQNPAKGSKVKALGNRLKKSLGFGSVSRKEAAKLRARYTHFRILVIGRANAGKTTLLKRKSLGFGSVSRKEAAKLRARYTHFRILVIGRANAGKTTLLKR
ncbi:hypothetical protein CVT25_002162, partial [Psilocybe cyanescens]